MVKDGEGWGPRLEAQERWIEEKDENTKVWAGDRVGLHQTGFASSADNISLKRFLWGRQQANSISIFNIDIIGLEEKSLKNHGRVTEVQVGGSLDGIRINICLSLSTTGHLLLQLPCL